MFFPAGPKKNIYCDTVLTPGRVIPPNQVPPETTVSSEDLRQTEREDAVSLLQPLLKEETQVASL